MTLPFEEIAAYVSGDLPAVDEERVEEHLFTCPACTRTAGELQALLRGLGELVPPILDAARLQALRDAGKRMVVTPVRSGETVDVTFAAELDLLIHVLDAPDLPPRVDIELFGPDDALLRTIEAIPCDREEGCIYIACQRHFSTMFPSDLRFRVVAVRGEQRERVGEYRINHFWSSR